MGRPRRDIFHKEIAAFATEHPELTYAEVGQKFAVTASAVSSAMHENGQRRKQNQNGMAGVSSEGRSAYVSFKSARYRCTNPKHKFYPDYGGRGIEFRFQSFAQFFAELGPRPVGKTLERLNNDGHYEPGNVGWATPAEQNNNRRPRRERLKLSNFSLEELLQEIERRKTT